MPTARSGLPRGVEAVIAVVGLAIVSPILLMAAVAVLATSRGPALFPQLRMGRERRTFTMLKLRTMRLEAGGPGITSRDDSRVTAIGRILRRSKVDELPELWNVVRGDMALVGPRPELPRYVDDDAAWDAVLSVRPGITDPVTLTLRDEESILPSDAVDRELFYRQILLPAKLRNNRRYLERRTWKTDIAVLILTALAIPFPRWARRIAPLESLGLAGSLFESASGARR